ncbi:MAG: PilZ domain-containing protein [Thermoanaerobaculia bacterium]|nr:PilZ domain-containing protein [Thermoanaerobaculia bacterium]
MADKRAFPRKKKRLIATFEVDGRTATGFTLDISHTGLLVSSLQLPKPGEAVRLTLQLQNGRKVECAGTVVRTRRLPSALAQGNGSAFSLSLGGYFEDYARLVSEGD